MRPTRQLSCLLLREREKLCNSFFFVLSVQSGDVQCVSSFLSRFSEKESMARQKRSRRNEPPQAMALILCGRFFLSKPQTLRWFAVWSPGDFDFPQTSSESKLPKRSLAQQGFLFWRFVPPLAMQTAGWVCIAETASVFLNLSRVVWKPNANPHCVANFAGSTDFLHL